MAKDSKLTETKRQWARDKRLLTGEIADPARDRLPPGQTLTQGFPVLDIGAQPEIGLERFRLDIDGAVRHPLSLRWDEFMALPQTEMVSDIHCVTQWSRYRKGDDIGYRGKMVVHGHTPGIFEGQNRVCLDAGQKKLCCGVFNNDGLVELLWA